MNGNNISKDLKKITIFINIKLLKKLVKDHFLLYQKFKKKAQMKFML